MDRFGSQKCLNEYLNIANKMQYIACGTSTHWWWKVELNNPDKKKI